VQVTFTFTSTPTGSGPYGGSPFDSLESYSVLVGTNGVVQFKDSEQTSEMMCSATTTL
jgi:hypothetical protein